MVSGVSKGVLIGQAFIRSYGGRNMYFEKTAVAILTAGVLAGCYTAESERQRYIRSVTEKCEAQGKQFILGDVQQEGIPHLTRFTTSVTGYCVDKNSYERCATEGKQTYILNEQDGSAPVRMICIQPNQLVRIPSPFGVDLLASVNIKGAEVLKVAPGSIAQRAGIKYSDVVFEFGGQSIGTASDLQAAVATTQAGQQVLIRFRRDEREASATAQF